jgi:hypothetical protein
MLTTRFNSPRAGLKKSDPNGLTKLAADYAKDRAAEKAEAKQSAA